jgi:hypothetical protein
MAYFRVSRGYGVDPGGHSGVTPPSLHSNLSLRSKAKSVKKKKCWHIPKNQVFRVVIKNHKIMKKVKKRGQKKEVKKRSKIGVKKGGQKGGQKIDKIIDNFDFQKVEKIGVTLSVFKK